MSTCRRILLDRALEVAIPLMKGKVLDIGGVRDNKRSRFLPPLDKVDCWKYVNINPQTQPDYCCDAANIPAENGSFNTIVMTELLEYAAEPQTVLNEAYRLLASNGTCIISMPFLNPVHADNHADRQRFTELRLKELSIAAGFNLVSVEAMGSLFSVVYDFLHVSLGYARNQPNKLSLKIARKFLRLFRSVCLWTDSKSSNLKKYINTGYFITLRKIAKNP